MRCVSIYTGTIFPHQSKRECLCMRDIFILIAAGFLNHALHPDLTAHHVIQIIQLLLPHLLR